MFRVLEDSAGGDTSCGVTPGGPEQHAKSENYKSVRYKKYIGVGDQLQMHRLAADGDLEAASRLRCAIGMRSSAVSRTALGELNNEASANLSKGERFCTPHVNAKIRSCSDNGAPGSPMGAQSSAIGALKLGANGQGGSSGAKWGKRDLKAPKSTLWAG